MPSGTNQLSVEFTKVPAENQMLQTNLAERVLAQTVQHPETSQVVWQKSLDGAEGVLAVCLVNLVHKTWIKRVSKSEQCVAHMQPYLVSWYWETQQVKSDAACGLMEIELRLR